jgi:hypothetical protein
MTSPCERVAALTERAHFLAWQADELDGDGQPAAAVASRDQALACDRDARAAAEASGDPELTALWEQS